MSGAIRLVRVAGTLVNPMHVVMIEEPVVEYEEDISPYAGTVREEMQEARARERNAQTSLLLGAVGTMVSPLATFIVRMAAPVNPIEVQIRLRDMESREFESMLGDLAERFVPALPPADPKSEAESVRLPWDDARKALFKGALLAAMEKFAKRRVNRMREEMTT